MFRFKDLDLSYNSIVRYIIDLHIFFAATLLFAYWLEQDSNRHPYIESVLLAYFVYMGFWLFFRLISFYLDTAVTKRACTKTKEEDESNVLLDQETEIKLMKYACEEGLTLSEIVQKAISEYVELQNAKLANR